MDNSAMLWPSNDMDFWEIKDDQNIVLIKWSQDVFKDYKELAYNFYDCGISTLNEIISSGHDNIKSDMWFLTGVFLIRQSIELGLKSLLCRITKKNHLQIVKKLLQVAQKLHLQHQTLNLPQVVHQKILLLAKSLLPHTQIK